MSQQLKQAMKSRDAAALKALRSIRAAFLTARKSENARSDSLNDAEAVAVLRKLAKMRQESIDMFAEGGRNDLVEGERAELQVIERWLPQLAGHELVATWVSEAIAKTGASKPSDMGKVMGYV